VGIGTASPSYALDVQTTGTSIASAIRSDQTQAYAVFVDSGTTLGHVRVGSESGALLFRAGNAERARLTSDGYLRMASGTGGIQFNGDTAAANALDDYEEGTYTPAVSSSSGTITSFTASGAYTKIGRIVIANFVVTVTNNGTGAGALAVSLPFTSAGSFVGTGRENALTGEILQIFVTNSINTNIYDYNNNYPAATNAQVVGTITYSV
jgi:hypothetical protein